MKLHYLPGACSLAAHIVLEWIGAPYRAVQISDDSAEWPAYRRHDEATPVPMLEHGDFVLRENLAILGYLADLHPEARLFGNGSPCGRAEVMRWLGFLDGDVHKAFLPLLPASFFLTRPLPLSAPAQGARRHLQGGLARLDEQLAGRDWLVGTRSIADPYLLVILRWAADLDIGLYGLEHLMRFARRMEDDPGVQAAIVAEEGVLA